MGALGRQEMIRPREMLGFEAFEELRFESMPGRGRWIGFQLGEAPTGGRFVVVEVDDTKAEGATVLRGRLDEGQQVAPVHEGAAVARGPKVAVEVGHRPVGDEATGGGASELPQRRRPGAAGQNPSRVGFQLGDGASGGVGLRTSPTGLHPRHGDAPDVDPVISGEGGEQQMGSHRHAVAGGGRPHGDDEQRPGLVRAHRGRFLFSRRVHGHGDSIGGRAEGFRVR